MYKKGQMTIFIIIGLFLIISSGMFFYFRSRVTKLEVAPELAIAGEVPTQFQEIDVFITTCIKRTATEGVKLIGAQGGYIDLDESGITARAEPTEGKAVYFSPGSELKLPYWFYLKSDNECRGTCEFSNERPELYGGRNSITEQLEKYVNDNLGVCIDDFNALKRKGYRIEELEEPSTRITIGDFDVTVLVDYPLRISIGDAETEINQFISYVPVKLKDIYDFASHIANLEAEFQFIENDVLNLIVGFSGKDKSKLPPMAATGVGVGKPIYWQKSRVKDNIEGMLTAYIPLLQVEGTLNFAPISFPGNDLIESIYNQAMLIPNTKAYDLEASFSYLGWPLYFDLNCNGEICAPESGSIDLIPNFGLERYNFVYDLSFPVMIEIRDPEAFGFEGYDFRFMLEANVRNNEPLKTKFEPLEAAELPDASMLCDFDKRNSGEIIISTKDDMTGKGIDDVIVSYSCADETCLMGISEDGALSEKFPVCFGGIVNFAKEGYISYSSFLNTEPDVRENLEVTLTPILTREFKIKKKRMVKNPEGWVFINTPLGLGRNESAFITLTRAADSGEGAFTTVVEYTGGIGEIELAPGSYTINARLSTTEPFVIPEEERCEEIILGMEECYTIDRFEFNESFVIGGLSLNYTFTNDDLRNDIVVFYAINNYFHGIPPTERRVEDLEEINKVDEYSAQYGGLLRPTFE